MLADCHVQMIGLISRKRVSKLVKDFYGLEIGISK